MTILVTGSAGHLGEALVRSLRAAGRTCRGLDRVASPFTDVVGSIVEPAVVERAMAGIDQVIHAATLHKPHVATHSRQAFVDTNITGTLNLLEAAVRARVRAFVFTSTTSVFGDALVPPPDRPAAWITEDVVPVAKNIYGVTKLAAEELCALAHRNQDLAVLVLRTSRFFPEADDDPRAAASYTDANLKTTEYLYRRVDVEDAVDAHLIALERAPALGFARYIITATTPFTREDAGELRHDPQAVLDRRVPAWRDAYRARDWKLVPTFDRVYDNTRARVELGWQPRHDFATVLARADVRSPLARAIGSKGYAA
ncbi:MAG: NAD(P)-dependent oxidoreductase [Kofleriaceae bacterium]